MVGYIYKITMPNGKIYIGQTNNYRLRLLQYKSIRKDPKKISLVLKTMYKYGYENCIFEVIEECDIIIINEREIYWIEEYKSNICKYRGGNGLNLTCGGEGVKNYIMPKEVREKIRVAHKGRKQDPAHTKNSAKARTGLKRTEEQKAKMSVAQTGKKISEEAKRKSSAKHSGAGNFFYGKKHDEKTKLFISALIKNNHATGAYEKQRIESSTLIFDTLTGVYYHGFREAGESVNIKAGTLRKKVKEETNHGCITPLKNNTKFILA